MTAERTHRRLHAGRLVHHDHGHFRAEPAELAQQIEGIAVRQAGVNQHAARFDIGGGFDQIGCTAECVGLETRGPQGLCKRTAEERVSPDEIDDPRDHHKLGLRFCRRHAPPASSESWFIQTILSSIFCSFIPCRRYRRIARDG